MGWGDKLKARRPSPSGRGIEIVGAQPPLSLKDDRGREVALGDEVLVLQPGTIWRVAVLGPAVDPKLPPGAVHARLVATLDLVAESGARVEGLFRLRQAQELGGGPGSPAPVPEATAPEGEPSGETEG